MAEPEPILPQRATHAEATITSVQWLFEPCWSGDRLMARLQDGRVSLTDAAGEPAELEHGDAAEALLAAIDAGGAVIDGIWTSQPFRLDRAATRAWDDERRAFVAFDLVELDGQSLAHVPCQERRRLLASVLSEGPRVRISPFVRQPLGEWLHVWRANGFTHYVAKQVNSRYHPGERTEDWLILSAEPEKISIIPVLLGRRPKKLRRIED